MGGSSSGICEPCAVSGSPDGHARSSRRRSSFSPSALIPFMSTGLVPPGNYGFSVVQVELTPGSTLADTRAVAEEVRRRLTQFPDVTRVYTTVGAPRQMASPAAPAQCARPRSPCNSSRAASRSARSRSSSARRRSRSRRFPGVRLSFGFGGFGEKLQISLAGDDPNLLADVRRAWSGTYATPAFERDFIREPRAAGDCDHAGAGACR